MSKAILNKSSTEKLECPCCQRMVSVEFVEQWNEYRLLKCPFCGLTFSDPMKAGDPQFYEAHTQYDDKWEFEVVLDKAKQMRLRGSLLDIGCGDGRFLMLARERFDVAGLDFNVSVLEALKSEMPEIEVYPMRLGDFLAKYPSKLFDVVTGFHILEHVENPHGFIANIKKCLKPQGCLALSVPNAHRWTLRWAREIWDYPPHHLTRWTRENVVELLRRHGFEAVQIFREPMTTFQQFRDAVRDMVWSIFQRKFSFGIASRLEGDSGSSKESPGRSEGKAGTTWRRALRWVLVSLKGVIFWTIVYVLTFATYPFLREKGYEGKSLSIIARMKNTT